MNHPSLGASPDLLDPGHPRCPEGVQPCRFGGRQRLGMGTSDLGPGTARALTVSEIEARRRVEQGRLDGLKTLKERNRLGQFATPAALALDIARYAAARWQGRPDRAAFLDPAIGTGSFYSAFRQAFPATAIADACGVEIDPAFASAAEALWEETGLRVIRGDFTRLVPDRPYNLILANPPYVRHHHLPREDKERLKALISDRFGIAISGLAGHYVHFLLLADAWLADGGLAIWLVPSEFLDVNYGSALKSYLTGHVTLRQIHRYGPADGQFGDALVTSAIVVFEKTPPPRGTRGPPVVRGTALGPGDERIGPPGDPPLGPEVDGIPRQRSAREVFGRDARRVLHHPARPGHRGQRLLHPGAGAGPEPRHSRRIPQADPAGRTPPPG